MISKDFKVTLSQPFPFSEDNEDALIGAVLIDPSVLPGARLIVEPKDFYVSINGQVWLTLCKMSDQGLDIDVVTVDAFLDENSRQHAAPSPRDVAKNEIDARLFRYTGACPTALNWETYAEIVRRDSIARTCIRMYLLAIELLVTNGLDIQEMLDKTIEALRKYQEELSDGN